jgi:hypothetical protein
MKKLLAILKKVSLGIGIGILVLFIIFALYLAYGIYAENSASRKAASICASVSPGDETSGLRESAISDGAFWAKWFESEDANTLLIMYMGFPPFSRHICSIKAKDGRVISAELTYLD